MNGNMIDTGRPLAARNIACNCMRNTPGLSNPTRMARHPSAGLGSSTCDMYGNTLSDPISSVRNTTRLPCAASKTRVYNADSSDRFGIFERIKNCNSVRNNPTPSAPELDRLGKSAIRPAFMYIVIFLPSAVTAGKSRMAEYFSCACACIAILSWNDFATKSSGRRCTKPCSASTKIGSPFNASVVILRA